MAAMRNGNGNGNSVSSITSSVAPWLVALLGFVGFFWQLVSPRDDLRAIEHRLDEKVDQLEMRMERSDSDLEHMMKDRITREEHSEFAKRKDKDTERLEKDIDGINGELVKRSEHMQHWAEQTERTNTVRDQVQEIRRDLTSSASIGKQFDNIIIAQRADRESFQAQMTEMRRIFDVRSSAPPPAAIVAPNATIKP